MRPPNAARPRSVPGDQLGMLNHTTDATRAAALRRVRYGRLYDLGRVLGENLPAFPGATSG